MGGIPFGRVREALFSICGRKKSRPTPHKEIVMKIMISQPMAGLSAGEIQHNRSHVVSYLETGEIPEPPTNQEKKALVLEHADLQLQHKGEYTAVREMRKHLSWYTVGMPHSARFRQMINSMETMEELLAGVNTIFQ